MKTNSFTKRSLAVVLTTILLLVALPVTSVLAVASPTNYAQTGADLTGVGTVTWATPDNLDSNNNVYATADVAGGGTTITHYLRASNFGFAIPAGSTIDGVTVEIGRFSSGGSSPFIRDYQVKLVNGSATIVGNNKAVTATDWPTTEANATYGGAADNWSAGLTAADINDTDFGVVLAVINANTNTNRNRVASVDYIRVTVNYTPDTTKPVVNTFTATTPTNSLNIPVTAFTASDTGGSGLAGYLITESSTPPSAGAAGWTVTAPTTYTVGGAGTYILYPWAKDAAGNVSLVFATPRTVVVDTTAPTVSSINRADADPTNAPAVNWTVTFSETVTGVGTNDFALVEGGGLSGASITGVTGSGPYTVTANTGSGNGTLGLNLAASPTVNDTAGNALTAPFTGQVYTVNKLTATTTTVGTSNSSITYGDTVTFTGTVSPAGATGTIEFYDGLTLLGSDTSLVAGVGTLDVSTLDVAGSPHSITAKYLGNATYAGSTSSVMPQSVVAKQITITPNAGQTKVFGASDPLPFTYTHTALVGSDTISGALGRVAGENVGTYAYTLNTLDAGANYDLVMVASPATFSITIKTITITPDAGQNKVYGASDPALTYTHTALVGSDTIGGLLGRVAGENVGTYAFTLGTLDAGANYDLVMVASPATFSITIKTITITPDAGQTKVYGASEPALTYTHTALAGSDTISGSLGRVAGENVGAYAFTLNTLDAGTNYSLVMVASPATFEITPKQITITPDTGQTKVFGASDPLPFTYTHTALVGSDTISGALGRVAGENVGAYAFTLNTLDAGTNYDLVMAASPATFSITAKVITITPDAGQTKVFGASDPAFTYTHTALVASDTISGALGRETGENVGTYAFTLNTLDAGTNYSLVMVASPATFSITSKPITITVTPGQSKIVGAVDPVFAYTSSDGAATFTGALARAAGESVGTYAINQGSLAVVGSNYTITSFVPADFTISAKLVTVTVTPGQTKVFGALDPTFAYTSDEPLAVFTGELGRVAGENVGAYTINVGTLSAGTDYSIVLVPADFTITAKPITVTPNDGQSKIYGVVDPAFTYTFAPALETGDSFTGALGRAAGENVGTYAFTLGSVSAGSNYSLSVASGHTFAITAKAITVIPDDNQSKAFGAADPVFTYTSNPALEAGDSFSGLLGRDPGTSIGTYAFTMGTLSAGSNYTLSLEAGHHFTITAKQVTVVVDSGQSKVFGQLDPVFTYVPDDLSAVFTGALSRVAGENAGTYAITIGTLSAGTDYSIVLVPADFTITPKPITVTANSGQTKTYGNADPVFTYTSSDAAATFTGALARATGENIGSYAINQGTLAPSTNYSIATFVPADFSITVKTLTVTADNKIKIIGDPDPAFTFTPTGFAFSDTFITDPTCSVSGAHDALGTYDINCSGGDAGANYTITYVKGTLTVRPAVTIPSPVGDIGTVYTPTYYWSEVPGSTWYYLWVNGPSGNVIKQWYTAVQASCNGTFCSITPTTTLAGGAHTWWIQPWNSTTGAGTWSTPTNFTVTPLGGATLLAPTGSTASNYNPTYSWNAVPGSTWYYLWVKGPSGPVIQQWYTAAQANCTTTCSVTPTTTLAGGAHTWWIQTWNPAGVGPWSSAMTFSTDILGPATLVGPTGSQGTNYNPTYSWNAVPGATFYYLWVNGPAGNVIKQWYTSAEAGCASDTSCDVTPATTLAGGNHTWWIQTWNPGGTGPWSSGMSFATVPLGSATLVSPITGTTNGTPTFTWNAVPGSTWYYLWVNGPSGVVIQKWYTAAQAGCAGGGTCSVVSPITLSSGTQRWWIQTWNSAGVGPWSAGASFNVTP